MPAPLTIGTSRALLSRAASPISSLLGGLISDYTLNEASGSRADSTVSANTLAQTQIVTQAVGKIGNAAQFTQAGTVANSPYLSCADVWNLSIKGALHISAWVYLDSKTNFRVIVAKGSLAAAGSAEYGLFYNQSTDRFNFTVSNGSTSQNAVASTFGSPPLATWILVDAWHIPGVSVNIAINGGATDTQAYTGGGRDGTAAFMIGNDRVTPTLPMDGRIDQVDIWARVLSSAERTAKYNGGAGVAWPFTGVSPGIGHVTVEGDSRSTPNAVAGITVWPMLAAYPTGVTATYELPVGGKTVATMVSQGAARIDPYVIPGYKNIAVLWGGVNDCVTDNAATIHGNIQTWCAARRAAGFKVVVCTEIDAQSAAANTAGWHTTIMPALNALIYANWTTYADVLCDLAAEPNLMDALNTTYFNADKVHPNTTGQGIIAARLTTALASV